MKKFCLLTLCVVLLFGMIFAASAAYAANTYTEAEILDMMATSWIYTCDENIRGCRQGLLIYALGQMSPENELQIKAAIKKLNEGVSNGYIETQHLQIKLNVQEYCEALDSDEIKSDIETFMNTSAAEMFTEEWEAHIKALANINDIVKNGEVADGVDVIDIIKENYAFFIGLESCTEAKAIFNAALDTDDLSTKRALMLSGASLATFGCEMSIEKADDVVKGKDLEKKPEDIMVDIAEASIDVVSEIVPEIGIFYDTLTITADVGIKLLSMQNKMDALAGYLAAPDTIEEDKNAYYDALSNQYDRFSYEISDFEIIMDEYNGYLRVGDDYKEVDVPKALYGFPVVAFDGIFADGLNITEITIPETITSRNISPVVKNCDKLEKVYYNAVNCKGWYLHYFFDGCDSDFEVIFGEGVEVIPEQFIARCGLSSITFPEGITTMYAGALKDCPNLKRVTIPSTVETFEISFDSPAVVEGCANLEKVSYNAISPEGSYYNAVFSNCGNSTEEMQLIFGEKVKITPVRFLDNCGVKSVVFPEGITKIREYAITGCQRLQTITIPSTITSFNENLVSDYVFAGCNELKAVNYNAKKVTGAVGAYIFYDIQSDFQMNFGEGIENIPENFISKCGLTTIDFPEGVKTIRYNCLVDCDSLKTVTVPSTVTTIEYNFADDCDSIETIYFNANCTTSPNSAMISDCGDFANPVMAVHLGENVTTVPAHFIQNCAITDFVYPEGVKTIHKQSLVNCSALERVVIGSAVEQLNYQIVKDCSNLKAIEYNAINAEFVGDYAYVFYCSGDADGMEVRFAENIESLPRRFMYDCSVRSVEFPGGLTKIPERTFYGCTALTSLTIPQNITAMDDDAFGNCTGLTEIRFDAVSMNDMKSGNGVFSSAGEKGTGITVTVGDKVTRLPAYLFCPHNTFNGDPKITDVQFENESVCTSAGKYAFAYCASLPTMELPDSVTTIGEASFYQCTGLTGVTIANGVTAIGESAFSGCESLSSITIPDSVTTIGESVFSDCTSLSTATIGNSVAEIARYAFSDCTALTSIAIPDGITCIDYSAFSGCTDLIDITIQDSITDIARNAFLDCIKLQSVIYCGTEKQWNAIDIAGNNAALTDAQRQYHNYQNGICAVCGDKKCAAHTWEDGACAICKQQLAEAIDLNGDGRVTVFDAQILAEAKVGLRILTDEQREALGDLSPEQIVDYILGRFHSAE